jgi:hypothetical protein
VGFENLTVFVLEEVAHLTVQHSGTSMEKRTAVFIGIDSQATCLDPDAADLFVL